MPYAMPPVMPRISSDECWEHIRLFRIGFVARNYLSALLRT